MKKAKRVTLTVEMLIDSDIENFDIFEWARYNAGAAASIPVRNPLVNAEIRDFSKKVTIEVSSILVKVNKEDIAS